MFIVIDTETTGLVPGVNQVWELAAVAIDGDWRMVSSVWQIEYPQLTMSREYLDKFGWPKYRDDCPKIRPEDIGAELDACIKRTYVHDKPYLVGKNVSFDVGMLAPWSHRTHCKPEPIELGSVWLGKFGMPIPSLEQMAKTLGLYHDAHTALGDAVVTAQILKILIKGEL